MITNSQTFFNLEEKISLVESVSYALDDLFENFTSNKDDLKLQGHIQNMIYVLMDAIKETSDAADKVYYAEKREEREAQA